jgi:hypothetical protein
MLMDYSSVTRPSPPSTRAIVTDECFCAQVAALLLCEVETIHDAFIVGPGEVLCIPRGVVHRFDNDREVDAKMLAIVSPGILSPEYFREMAAVVMAATGGPPEPAAIAEVMQRHGLSPAA